MLPELSLDLFAASLEDRMGEARNLLANQSKELAESSHLDLSPTDRFFLFLGVKFPFGWFFEIAIEWLMPLMVDVRVSRFSRVLLGHFFWGLNLCNTLSSQPMVYRLSLFPNQFPRHLPSGKLT